MVNNLYRKTYERECISGFISTSDVLKVLKFARAVGECNLRTIFYLLYIQQNYSVADSSSSSCSCSYSSVFGFTFLSVAYVCQTFNQVCVVFNVFLFFSHFIQVAQRCFGLTKPTDSPPFFFIWCTHLALPQCFHGNSHITLYNLFMHSSLTKQNLRNLLSI